MSEVLAVVHHIQQSSLVVKCIHEAIEATTVTNTGLACRTFIALVVTGVIEATQQAAFGSTIIHIIPLPQQITKLLSTLTVIAITVLRCEIEEHIALVYPLGIFRSGSVAALDQEVCFVLGQDVQLLLPIDTMQHFHELNMAHERMNRDSISTLSTRIATTRQSLLIARFLIPYSTNAGHAFLK
jgi:hypothetical protein